MDEQMQSGTIYIGNCASYFIYVLIIQLPLLSVSKPVAQN